MVDKRDTFSDRDLDISQINARREKMNQLKKNFVVFKGPDSDFNQGKRNLSDNTATIHERDKDG